MSDYKQVSCSFYDQLTDLIVRKKYVHLEYTSEIHEFLKEQCVLVDIKSFNNQEFLFTNKGTEVRLDRIKKVDGIIPPHVDKNYYQCDC